VRGRFSRSLRRAAIDMPERLRTFDLVASHHQIKKVISLRPLRLCGENPIFDKSGLGND